MRSAKWLLSLPFFLGIGVALGRAAAPTTPPAAPPAAGHFDAKAVDRSVDPCTDFYEFACNKWMAQNPIPADQPAWGRGSELALRNQFELRDILEQAAKEQPGRSAVNQKIGDYYASCMDEKAIDQKGIASLQPELLRIEALRGKDGLPDLLAHLHRITNNLLSGGDSGAHTALFGFGQNQDFDDASRVVAAADQGGLGLPDRDYYLKTDPKSVEVRKQYQDHVRRMFALLGEPPARADADAKVVLDIETALARSSMDIVKRRDPANLNHKMTREQLAALTPNFSWDRYLAAIAAPPSAPHYLVTTPDFFRGMDALLAKEALENLKTYLRWNLVHASANVLPAAFVSESFNFFGRTLRGAKELRPRWKRCVTYTDADLGEALGQAYVERTFGAEGKQRMLQLVHALKQSLGSDIQSLPWMGQQTKKEAQIKLAAIEDKIGYPDRWRDYSSLRIVRGDALGNAMRAGEFEMARQLHKIGKPVDRGEWLMTPSTVNAYYDAQLNTINFPAGILQPPFFDKGQDDAVNLGAIGSVIGHELTHGFDDQGRKFDPRGNLRDWWTETDAKKFERRTQCVADQYSGYSAVGDVKLNGRLTLGENTADNGGLRVALLALRELLGKQGKGGGKVDGFTPEQRFFLSYGQSWCSNLTPEMLRVLAATNPHSPGRHRVNGVLSNMPEFQKAFACKQGQPMVRENACRVW